ncbi:MAG: amidohydrolase family protein [Rhodobacteraceae bacterium]|nr:amidohydrolase family protein [Paracoccaceae bacterium]
MRIDSHQHFWKLGLHDYNWLTPDLTEIYRDVSPADLRPILDPLNIDGTIAVQADPSEAETDYLLKLADTHNWILGVVGWVDMELPSAVASINRLAQNPKFVGIRPAIQSMDDDDWMLRPSLAPAINALIEKNLCFDALVLPRHLKPLRKFLDRYPNLRVVIDHGAKPEIAAGHFDSWAADITDVAQNSSSMCKLSGLVTEAGEFWNLDKITPYANHILNSFGPNRTMFGSDWPVVDLAFDYQGWTLAVNKLCHGYSKVEKANILGNTAHRFYLANRMEL